MRIVFLTSTLGTYKKIKGKKYPCFIENSNHFLEQLKQALPKDANVLLIPADPNSFEKNEETLKIMKKSFNKSKLSYKKLTMLNQMNQKELLPSLSFFDAIILCGGHLPTQNKWFQDIHLKERLKVYPNVLIAESAGSMNCAGKVYSCPESEEEIRDSTFNKWLDGLDIISINLFPHYHKFLTTPIGKTNLIFDIVRKDSINHPIYALSDGSYIKMERGQITIYGECFKIWNEKIINICQNKESLILNLKEEI
jgi:dipeptidase E